MPIQIEFAIEYFQDVTHKCPSCHAILGRYLCVNMFKKDSIESRLIKKRRSVPLSMGVISSVKSRGMPIFNLVFDCRYKAKM